MTFPRFSFPRIALMATVSLSAMQLALAQGSFRTFGKGCIGTGTASCPANNPNASSLANWTQNGYAFALRAAAQPRATVVDGFELYTRAISRPTSILAWMYTASNGRPDKLVGRGTMTVGTTLGWHRVRFNSPVPVPANAQYFIAYTGAAGQMYFPMLPTRGNTLGTHFWYYNNAWAGPFATSAWVWRVNCRQAPEINCKGVPTVGRTHVLNLSGAKPNSTAFLAYGSKRLNPGIPWPGAPDCQLLTDSLLVLRMSTDKFGSISVLQPVPNDPSLKGKSFLQQFAVVDRNPAVLVFSAGAEVKL